MKKRLWSTVGSISVSHAITHKLTHLDTVSDPWTFIFLGRRFIFFIFRFGNSNIFHSIDLRRYLCSSFFLLSISIFIPMTIVLFIYHRRRFWLTVDSLFSFALLITHLKALNYCFLFISILFSSIRTFLETKHTEFI